MMLYEGFNSRLQGWVTFSHKLFGIQQAPHFAINIQKCGQSDIKICEMEEQAAKVLAEGEHLIDHQGMFMFSEQWICFFYEVLRSYKEFQEEVTNSNPEFWFQNIYEKLKLLRMPIAKLQVQGISNGKKKNNYKKGYHAPTSIFFPTIPSVGWQVFSKDGSLHSISRRLLADEFLMVASKDVSAFEQI